MGIQRTPASSKSFCQYCHLGNRIRQRAEKSLDTSRPNSYIEANEGFRTIATPTQRVRKGVIKKPLKYEAKLVSAIEKVAREFVTVQTIIKWGAK